MNHLKKIQYNSPVVLTFFLLSLAALLLGMATTDWSTRVLFSVYRSNPVNPLTWLRLLTHVLGHQNYGHLIGNMMLLLVVGPPLEERYGSRNLLIAIAVTAVVSGGILMLFFPRAALLGASGVVFMMILLSSLAGMKEGKIPLTLILVALLYVGGEVVSGITQRDNVSQLSHIIGALCGGALGFWFNRTKQTQ